LSVGRRAGVEVHALAQDRVQAVNARIIRDAMPYVWRPGEGRVYSTRAVRAELPVEFEPSALQRDRERHRDLRTRREMRGAGGATFHEPRCR
jgi:hypothetical protein